MISLKLITGSFLLNFEKKDKRDKNGKIWKYFGKSGIIYFSFNLKAVNRLGLIPHSVVDLFSCFDLALSSLTRLNWYLDKIKCENRV